MKILIFGFLLFTFTLALAADTRPPIPPRPVYPNIEHKLTLQQQKTVDKLKAEVKARERERQKSMAQARKSLEKQRATQRSGGPEECKKMLAAFRKQSAPKTEWEDVDTVQVFYYKVAPECQSDAQKWIAKQVKDTK